MISKPNCTFEEWSQVPDQATFKQMFFIIFILSILIATVIMGNALVIMAVLVRRRLRTPTGLLILSLAVADLLASI